MRSCSSRLMRSSASRATACGACTRVAPAGVTVNHKRVWRVMHEFGRMAARSRRFLRRRRPPRSSIATFTVIAFRRRSIRCGWLISLTSAALRLLLPGGDSRRVQPQGDRLRALAQRRCPTHARRTAGGDRAAMSVAGMYPSGTSLQGCIYGVPSETLRISGAADSRLIAPLISRYLSSAFRIAASVSGA